MTGSMGLYSSWSRPCAHRQVPPTPSKCAASLSSPIPIPRRQSVHPPPCSPTRAQDSPELVFNFDFSISPDGSDASNIIFQQHDASVRRVPRQKAAYAPLAILGTNDRNVAHPYAHEPFLYPIPKLPSRDEGTRQMHESSLGVNYAATKEQIAPSPPPASIHSISSLSSVSSFHSSNPCYPPTNVSCQFGADGDFSVTSAFQKPAVSFITSPSVSPKDLEPSLSPSTPCQTPSPLRPLHSNMHIQRIVLNQRLASHRIATAAPIVSLSVVQADRSDRSMGIARSGRSRSPGPGRDPPRARRSSSASARLGLEKFREPSRQMGTVIGRGAGRVISMLEYGHAGARSLVSDEDIEGSLEKNQAGRPQGADRDRRRVEECEKESSARGCINGVLERGRARARVCAQSPPGAAGTYALPGW